MRYSSALHFLFRLSVSLILFFLFLFLPKQSNALHCPYDGLDGFSSSCSVTYHEGNNEAGSCLACIRYDVSIQRYIYVRHHSKVTFVTSACPSATDQADPQEEFQLAQLSNVNGCWVSGGVPTGCNQNYDCDGDSPPPPPPGGCNFPDQMGACSQPGHACCTVYDGVCCSGISDACKPVMGCPPQNTPTPTPYCTLSCPGQGGTQVGGGDGSVGTGDGKPVPTGIEPPTIVGNIVYNGFSNFLCGLFKNGVGYDGACPPNLPGNTFTEPVRYNMLCGGSSHTYTAQVDSGAAGGALEPTPTAGLTPTGSLYPPGCVLNPSIHPTPTIIAGGGGLGGSSAANYCSCSVTLGCQTRLYPVQESGICDDQCNFSINPDNAVYNEPVSFAITGTPDSLEFDDGSDRIINPSGTINHTFVNAGSYRIQASCLGGVKVCSKELNIYCTYIPKLWYKFKDANFHKYSSLNNPIPTTIIPYDGDDDGSRVLVLGQAGTVSGQNNINIGSDPASVRDWKKSSYSMTARVTPQSFLEYVKSRKQYVTVTSGDSLINANELTTSAINVATGNFTLDSASIQSKSPFVLIIVGDATITGNINPPAKSLAVIATGNINIMADVTELNGIFIANAIDFASDITAGNTTNKTLKVVGNVVSQTATDMTKRQGDDISRPSIFVVVKSEMYIDMLPLLSVRNYQWLQLTP